MKREITPVLIQTITLTSVPQILTIDVRQSTNDVYPSAGKLAMIRLMAPLFDELEALISTLLGPIWR